MDVVYSVGHSSRSSSGFISLLQRHHVDLVADVRRWPTSRFERFSREGIVSLLREHGIGYVHLEPLGAFRPRGYRTWMQTRAWQQAYRQLVALAWQRTTAFMCAERLPQRCHRRYIAQRLTADGWRVVHLIDDSATQATLER
ncbi:MAG: DUF488 domain-containing protein [Thermoplasmatota archaeon]